MASPEKKSSTEQRLRLAEVLCRIQHVQTRLKVSQSVAARKKYLQFQQNLGIEYTNIAPGTPIVSQCVLEPFGIPRLLNPNDTTDKGTTTCSRPGVKRFVSLP